MSATAWMFPGQGSQAAGMGWALCREFPRAAEIMEHASELSRHPLAQYCFEGPESMLRRTDVLQPALTAVGLGLVDYLRHHGLAPDAVAGHSLGEFAALYAAEVLTLDDALHLVAVRGRLMHRAAEVAPGGMLAVKGVDASTVRAVVAEAGTARLAIANYNAPEETVLSGEADALAWAAREVTALGGRGVPLNVSGAWHSPLMADAAEAFAEVVRAVPFAPPRRGVYLNATGAREDDPAAIREAVAGQLVAPVHWHRTLRALIGEGGVRRFVEVGPGKVLRGLLRRTWRDADAYEVHGFAEPRSLSRLQPAGAA